MAIAATANIITASSIENAVFAEDLARRRFIARSNPYGMYNNQDRLLNAIYRNYAAFDTLKDQITESWRENHGQADPTPAQLGELTWEYEKISSFMSQHFWSFEALVGVGNAINAPGFGRVDASGNVDLYGLTEASVTLGRQSINAILEGAIEIANRFRYSEKLKDGVAIDPVTIGMSTRVDRLFENIAFTKTIADWKKMRTIVGAAVGSVGFTVNAMVGAGMSAAMLSKAMQDGDLVRQQIYAVQLTSMVLNVFTNAAKAASGILPLKNPARYTPGGYTSSVFGTIGSAVGVFQALTSAATLAPYLNDPSLTPEQKASIGAEMGIQVVGGLMQIACNSALARAALAQVTGGLRILGPAIGGMVAAIAVGLSPMQISAMVQQSEYANRLDDLGRTMSASGYQGDSLLAAFYNEKSRAEGFVMAATNALSIVGAAFAVASACSAIGTPISVLVTLVTGIASGILTGVQQKIIEDIAANYAGKINQQGGSFKFFAQNLLAQYSQFLADPDTRKTIIDLQTAYGVESVVGVTTIGISKTALELAAITQNAANLKSADATIDRFVQGSVVADQTITVDPEKGNLNINGDAGTRQLITFLTPLMSPGEEKRTRVSTGKNSYFTSLDILLNGPGWTITDGAADTVIDTRKIVTRLYKSDNSLQKALDLIVNGGAGNNTLIANTARTILDGGAGQDTISYLGLSTADKRTGIVVTATATGFEVKKTLYEYDAYKEISASQNYQVGKQTEGEHAIGKLRPDFRV